jgi:alkylation response protein AidB-like acyl-CoA dehydrogenase
MSIRNQDSEQVLKAIEIQEELSRRADEIEDLRRLPADISARLAAEGFYRTMIPEAYGGLELDPAENLQIFETLAQADASTAWCVFIAATSGTMLASIPESAAREVFCDPDISLAGVFAPMGRADMTDGGFRVNGEWQWGSHSQNADWIAGGCRLFEHDEAKLLDSGSPQTHMMLAKAEDIEFLDNWNVSGLSGTGSTNFAMRDVFVPEDRAVGYKPGRPLARPLYVFPQFGLLALGIAGVSMGIARSAIDELISLATDKVPQGSTRSLANRPATQASVAKAEVSLASTRCHLYSVIDAAWQAACGDGRLTTDHRRDLRLATTHTTQTCAEVVDSMYNLGGGTSVYRRSKLQRLFRDIHVATQHAMVGVNTLELTGRLFLGLDTNIAML